MDTEDILYISTAMNLSVEDVSKLNGTVLQAILSARDSEHADADVILEHMETTEVAEGITVISGGRLAMAFPLGLDWAVEEAWMFTVLSMLDSMSTAELTRFMASDVGQVDHTNGGRLYKMYDGVAHIPVTGLLTKRPSCMGRMFGDGGSSTIQHRQALRAANSDPSVQSKLQIIDSPGGEVGGVFDAANDALKGKPTDSFYEDMGASGALAIGSVGRFVMCNDSAVTGSCGVYTSLADRTEADKQRGVRYHVVHAGKLKAIGAPGNPITDDHIKEVQKRVDSIHGLFLRHMTKTRTSMTSSQLQEIADAGVYVGRQAVKAGLVDSIGDVDMAHREAVKANKEGRRKSVMISDKKLKAYLSGETDSLADAVVEETVADPSVAETQPPVVVSNPLVAELASAGISNVDDLRSLVTSSLVGRAHMNAERDRAKRLAVSLFGITTPEALAAVNAAERFIDAAPFDLVQATVLQYEAQLAASAANSTTRITAPQTDAGADVPADQINNAVAAYVTRAYHTAKKEEAK